jgi:hypothetical protein
MEEVIVDFCFFEGLEEVFNKYKNLVSSISTKKY